MKVSGLAALLVLIVICTAGVADYSVTSELEGWFCKGFIFKSCSIEVIDALSDEEGGQLFDFVDSIDQVTEYSESQGRCWLNNSPGYFAYRRLSDESWELIGVPDDVTFKCERQ